MNNFGKRIWVKNSIELIKIEIFSFSGVNYAMFQLIGQKITALVITNY